MGKDGKKPKGNKKGKKKGPKFPTGKAKKKQDIEDSILDDRVNGVPLDSPKIKAKEKKIKALEKEITDALAKQKKFTDLLAKHLKFALEKGYKISGKDFYHTHFIVDRKTGEIVGLIGHALEFSKKRKADNYIIFTSVQCFSKILIGGREGKGWESGFDDPEVKALGKDLWFPGDAKFGLPKKGKPCADDEKEMVIVVKLKSGKTEEVRICYKVRA